MEKDLKKLLELLDEFSYENKMGRSLLTTLRKVDKEKLIEDLMNYRKFLNSKIYIINDYDFKYRVKAVASIELKYKRYFPNKTIKSCFNDVLGIEVVVKFYQTNFIYNNLRVVDLSKGKKNDDGYRAVHLYYSKSNFHYPIEIKLVTKEDKFLNELLHRYVYKFTENRKIGRELRKSYEEGIITDENTFIEELKKIFIYK